MSADQPGGAVEVAAALRTAESVAIVSHSDPDGDSVGASLGLSLALDVIGVPNIVVLGSGEPCPMTYSFLPDAERCVEVGSVSAAADLAVLLDSSDLKRLGEAEPVARAARDRVIIDHHPGDGADARISIVDPTASATGLIIWELLPLLGVSPDARIATCLYTALLTDTGRFSFSNTTPRAFKIAGEMVSAGAAPNDIYMAVYESRSPAAQALTARVLSRLRVVNKGLVAYSWVDETDFAETGAMRAEAENLIDVVRPIAGLEIALFVKVDGDSVRVSLRSKGARDVSAIAAAFGGGGHRAAAGFTCTGSLDEVVARLLPVLPGSEP